MEIRFSELPDKKRFFYRNVIEGLGGYVAEYNGKFVTVALPREDGSLLIQTMRKLGLDVQDICFFPLCSDKPPEDLRHNGPYNPKPNPPGYWQYANFYVKTEE